MKKELRQKGFTLVELAIVMVIIGLLIGAVLKGQAMIDDAKQKRMMNDLQGISAAIFTYYDRYNAVPGDDSRDHGWGITLGNANGFFGGTEVTAGWQALRYSGLLSGDPANSGATAPPRSPYGGAYGFASAAFAGFGSTNVTKNYISIATVPGNVAEAIDIKFDDGVYNTGTVRANAAYTSGSVTLQYIL
jgi:prepilin-type N-terminal cleavage/methylation domain-containing protein